MQEDDPAELDRYREEALRLELQRYASRFHPAADFYTIAARFALNKLKLAEAGADPMGVITLAKHGTKASPSHRQAGSLIGAKLKLTDDEGTEHMFTVSREQSHRSR